ncbi:MAG: glucosaminidase domain-containing protein [Bdellovibrionota bacterium]
MINRGSSHLRLLALGVSLIASLQLGIPLAYSAPTSGGHSSFKRTERKTSNEAPAEETVKKENWFKRTFSSKKSSTPKQAAPSKATAPKVETQKSTGSWLSRLFKKDQSGSKKSFNGPQSPGSVKTVYTSSNVTENRFIDARYLDQRFKGKLKGQGLNIIKTAKKYGLDPVFFASVMAFETGWGNSRALRSYNNPGGLMCGKGAKCYKPFSSVEEGIDGMAANLKAKYLDEGRKTISSIASKYAPVGARNDPRGTNRQWPGSVTKIMNIFIQGSVNMGNQRSIGSGT